MHANLGVPGGSWSNLVLDSASTPYQCKYNAGRTWAVSEGSARKASLAARTFRFQFGGVGEDGRGPDEEAMCKRLI